MPAHPKRGRTTSPPFTWHRAGTTSRHEAQREAVLARFELRGDVQRRKRRLVQPQKRIGVTLPALVAPDDERLGRNRHAATVVGGGVEGRPFFLPPAAAAFGLALRFAAIAAHRVLDGVADGVKLRGCRAQEPLAGGGACWHVPAASPALMGNQTTLVPP